MSENHVSSNVKQAPKDVDQPSTMGNLFSKEDSAQHEIQREVLPGEEKLTDLPYSPPDSPTTQQDSFFKFFDKATKEDSLMNESSNSHALDSEKVLLNAFLNEVRNAKPAPLKKWSALQHYVYFIYRHAISEKPCSSTEMFPNIITKKIRDLIESLLQEDFTQLCMRLVALIREYSIIARGHYTNLQNPQIAVHIVNLLSYYSAFCSAASKLAPLIPEFDFLIMERFNVNFLCLNKSIFYYYIYKSPAVQMKIPVFNKLKEDSRYGHRNLMESYVTFSDDMSLIASRWSILKSRISSLCCKRGLGGPDKYLSKDWKMFQEQHKILKSNYWMVRNTQAMQLQDMTQLDGHVLSMVGDTNFIADFLLDNHGHCMCEDCLAAEFKTDSIAAAMASSYQAQSSAACRLITCYICQDPIALDALASHIVTKHNESHSQRGSRVYITPHQKRTSKKSSKHADSGKSKESSAFEGLFEKSQLKESLLKLVGEHLAQHNIDNPVKFINTVNDESNVHVETKEPLVQPLRKPSTENAFTSTGVEELKHKPAGSRKSEASCPIKPSASPIFQTPNESAFKSNKEPIFKIASEAPIMQNGNEMMFNTVSKSNKETQAGKVALDDFLKHRDEADGQSAINEMVKWKSTEVGNKKATEVLMKSAELFSNKDMSKTSEPSTSNDSDRSGKKSNFLSLAAANAFINNSTSTEIPFRKPQQKGVSNVDQKVLEFLKNANGQKSGSKSNDITCSGHACGHKCRPEEDKPTEVKKHACQEICEHHKESRKCDCAYCEVFGTSLTTHVHKKSETRDRLRTRLNQRKEKVSEGVNKAGSKTSLNTKLPSKNSSLNCTIKITGSSKGSVLNGKTVNVSTTSNAKPTNDSDARVPEVVHPVPPPSNTKPVLTSVEPKRVSSLLLNGQMSNPDIQELSGSSVDGLERENRLLRSSMGFSNSTLNSDIDLRDINELLNYIEGNKTIDKVALAQKKAAKKARQRIKKAQEREQIENEKRLKEEARLKEEKRKAEEEKLKAEALAKQLVEKQKKNKKSQEENKVQQKPELKKNKKKVKNNAPKKETEKKTNSNLIEETIPAMVTIKRVSEGNDSPATVTITLKGSTPESDKLLFTLVNGHNEKEPLATATVNTGKMNKSKNDSTVKIQSQSANKTGDNQKNSKKKKKDKATEVASKVKVTEVASKGKVTEVASKEVKVTIAVDKNNIDKKIPKKNVKTNETPKVPDPKVSKAAPKQNETKVLPPKTSSANTPKEEVNLPMFRLPPGITITKIEGPPVNRSCRVSYDTNPSPLMVNTSNSRTPSRTGVIVVDTEKLIQQSITANNNKKNKKKSKKKRDQKMSHSDSDKTNNPDSDKTTTEKEVSNSSGSPMVTLKNPIFHTLPTALDDKVETTDSLAFPNNQQASIFKNDNGMVTIRSPRLQSSYENGAPISSFLSDLQPMFGPEVSTPYVPMNYSNFPETSKSSSSFNAQEILSGLPGIEITKVEKSHSSKTESEGNALQPAEVSIIPTCSSSDNGAEKFSFYADDWPYESVFAPRDIPDDDLDADERELEAFKRFCQQSVPPERKEKVTHLNVKDIFKKRDVTYS